MTELKGLDEYSQSKIDEYFNSPLYRKFLTEFTIGHNKLKFYGAPLIMMQYSELIKTVISKDPPYVLATHGVIYEKPMTLLWIGMNDILPPDRYLFQVLKEGYLNLEEYLQLGRLFNYFDIKPSRFTELYLDSLDAMLEMSTSEDEKVIKTHKAQILKMAQQIIKIYDQGPANIRVGFLFNALLSKAPEVIDELKVLPMYDENKKYVGLTSANNITVPTGYSLVGKEGRVVKIKHIPFGSQPPPGAIQADRGIAPSPRGWTSTGFIPTGGRLINGRLFEDLVPPRDQRPIYDTQGNFLGYVPIPQEGQSFL